MESLISICEDHLVTIRLAIAGTKRSVQAVYGEKLISVEGPPAADGTTSKIEYRVWNPFRSKLAAAILGGVDAIHIIPGAKVWTFLSRVPLLGRYTTRLVSSVVWWYGPWV